VSDRNEQIPPMGLAAGFEKAFIGTSDDFAGHTRAVYDYGRCVRILMLEKGLTEDEAVEYMDFSVVGSFVGAAVPIFVQRMTYRDLFASEH
jgi:hypothetical protein